MRPVLLRRACCVGLIVASCLGQSAWADKPPEENPDDNTLDAAEADAAVPPSRRSRWNEYDGKYFSIRVGAGFLWDYARYSQDDESAAQMTLDSAGQLRDLRFLLKGKLKFLRRVSYSVGYMFDGANDAWRFRQTGLMVDFPHGHLFIGRTKEGFSTSKIMVGYAGFLNERAAANDAFLPILADGLKWTGDAFNGHLVYNVGCYTSLITPDQSYLKNDWQCAWRSVWLPFTHEENKGTQPPSKHLLHLALELRYGSALDGMVQFRSKPESFNAQSYAVDTGKFAAAGTTTIGFEVYYRLGPVVAGMEYFLNQVFSLQAQNPLFHGGELFVAFNLTGERRSYNLRGAFFEAVSPRKALFAKGPGAFELVARMSYVDLNVGAISGGAFWRVTPMLNWHLSNNVRFEFVYGYSGLDRAGMIGHTHYFQTRLQLTIM